MTGPSGPSQPPVPMPAAFDDRNGSSSHRGRNYSNTSFFRDSSGFYAGNGSSGEDASTPDLTGAAAGETLHPGPARQATVHPGGPYNFSPESGPTSPSANLLEGRSATPINGPSTPGYGPPGGSRFTEEV